MVKIHCCRGLRFSPWSEAKIPPPCSMAKKRKTATLRETEGRWLLPKPGGGEKVEMLVKSTKLQITR